jgi:hypothetical protein
MSFDPTNLLNISVDQANDTRLSPCPEGEYQAIIEKVDIKNGISQKNNMPWVRLDVNVSIDDPAVEAAIGRRPKLRGGVMLDLTDNGTLDLSKGKNTGLGRLREAAGKNLPGVPFKFTDLEGQLVKVKVSHRTDPNDPSIVYDEVKAFLKP